jgi:hypothetical protein
VGVRTGRVGVRRSWGRVRTGIKLFFFFSNQSRNLFLLLVINNRRRKQLRYSNVSFIKNVSSSGVLSGK